LPGSRRESAEGVRASPLAAAIALVIYAPISTSAVLKLRHVAGFNMLAGIANAGCTLIALIALGLSALAIPTDRAPQLDLLGLMSLLGPSVVMFSRVITSMLRPHRKGEGVTL
jgi:hypothetical protein